MLIALIYIYAARRSVTNLYLCTYMHACPRHICSLLGQNTIYSPQQRLFGGSGFDFCVGKSRQEQLCCAEWYSCSSSSSYFVATLATVQQGATAGISCGFVCSRSTTLRQPAVVQQERTYNMIWHCKQQKRGRGGPTIDLPVAVAQNSGRWEIYPNKLVRTIKPKRVTRHTYMYRLVRCFGLFNWMQMML